MSTERRAQVVSCLVEGMSIRATVRITGAAKNTFTKLLTDLGDACAEYQDAAFRNLDLAAFHYAHLPEGCRHRRITGYRG